ncbi:hypothetical protein ACTXJO_03080 [Psychrobacter celer]|uniref:hypothetical protein n=1 Tax=Psychrobacter celer TaxID=306572 RepID=UPI003FD022BF
MADLAEKDKQEFIQKIERLSDRELLSFMRIYTKEYGYELDIEKVNKPTFIKKIVNNKGIEQAIKILDYTLNQYILNENNFHWLYENLRAQIFTLTYMRLYYSEQIRIANKNCVNEIQDYLFPIEVRNINIDYKGEIIDAVYEIFDKEQIEGFPIEKSHKEVLMEKIRTLWSAINRKCDYTEWVNKADESKISWLERYLNRKGYYIDTIEAASTLDQRKALCLASLDLFEFKSTLKGSYDYSESSEKADFIDRMKRSWNQKVYRNSGRERKKYHLPLTNETKQRLDKIADVENRKQADILETLINDYYESNDLDAYSND